MFMTTTTTTNFEDLSDEILICILEYLSLEDFIDIFSSLNARFTSLIYDHPWMQHQLNIQTSDNETLRKKIEFIEQSKLISAISSIHIQPFSLYHTIENFQQLKSMEHFHNLRALSLQHITLEEAESIFTEEILSQLNNLTRLRLVFSFGVEQDDYANRLERIIARIFIHPSLRHCILHLARTVNFTELQSKSSIEYLLINYCSFQSLYTLFEFTPVLQHLTATIAMQSDSKIHKVSLPTQLNSVKLNLSIPAWTELQLFLKRLPKLRKVHLTTESIIEPLTSVSTWFTFITDSLPALIKFQRQSNVRLENIEEYLQAFRWPNGWHFDEKNSPNGKNYSRITVINTRY